MKNIRQLRRAQAEMNAARVSPHEALGARVASLSEEQFEGMLASTQPMKGSQPVRRRSPGSLERR